MRRGFRTLLTAILTTFLVYPQTQGLAKEVKKEIAKTEMEALKSGASGPNYKGESTDFESYLNDEQFLLKDDDIALIELDPARDEKVVLGAGDNEPAGVSYRFGFENSPIES